MPKLGLGRVSSAFVAGAAAVALASASHAATFATFSQLGTGPNVSWSNPGNITTGGTYVTLNSGGSTGSANVVFSFLDPVLAAAVSNVPASFSLTSSVPLGNPAVNTGSPFFFLDQPGLAGSFSFTYTGIPDLIVGLTSYKTGANLLSGVFNFADIQGKVSSSSGSAVDATASGGVITFTSAFMSFKKTIQRDFAINMTSISPLMNAASGKALKSFKASAGGAFSLVSPVPEPSTWAIMIVGFGMIGAASRRRRLAAS